jgi:hypothetical protein
MKRWTALCLSSALILVAGCQYNPHAHRFTKHKPAIAEAAGTYVLDEVFVDSVKVGLGKEIQNYAATSQIVLRHDGTARFVRFPVFRSPDDLHYTYQGPEDFEARWSVSPSGSVSSGGDDSQSVYGIQFTFDDGRTLFDTPTFTGSPRVDGMIFTISDPDMGEILGFRKR